MPTANPWLSATWAEVLATQAERQPDDVIVRSIEPGSAALEDCAITTLTFEELARRAASVALSLADCAEPGDRALLLRGAHRGTGLSTHDHRRG
jgi:acyl-CoA synthetase (AMP-forming)/AMP-acid ligase II